jgi:hypothetical protein
MPMRASMIGERGAPSASSLLGWPMGRWAMLRDLSGGQITNKYGWIYENNSG